jgi:hypothetical protein
MPLGLVKSTTILDTSKMVSNKGTKKATRRWPKYLIFWLPDLGSNQGPTD